MVMPFCFDGVKDMFEASAWNYTQFARDCHKKWNTMPRPDMADLMYGERRLQGASNIVFTNGLLDPWSSGELPANGSRPALLRSLVAFVHQTDHTNQGVRGRVGKGGTL